MFFNYSNMRKFLVVSLIVIVVIAVIYFILTSSNKATGSLKIENIQPNTTSVFHNKTNSSLVINKTKSNLSISTNYSNRSTTIKPTCLLSNASVIYIPNGNFSTGTYEDWNTTGTGFGNAPFNLSLANKEDDYYGVKWNNYGNTNFVASTFRGGLAESSGNLTSAPFLVNDSFLNFKIISPYDNELYIELLENRTPVVIAHFNTYNASGNVNGQSTFENASLPISEFMCHTLRIRIVAGYVGTSTTQYIMATGFYLSNKERTTPGILYQLNISSS